jgi:hypothetical protein
MAGAILLALMGPFPAQAGLAYSFHKTASNPADLPVSVEMSFADAATHAAGNALGGGFGGILDLVFTMGSVSVDLGDLVALQQGCAANPTCQPQRLTYDLAPGDGFLRFNNSSYDFAFTYGQGAMAGSFNTDFPGPAACRQSGTCRYDGTWLAVPEPVTLGLLGIGMTGLLAARRRRGPATVPA